MNWQAVVITSQFLNQMRTSEIKGLIVQQKAATESLFTVPEMDTCPFGALLSSKDGLLMSIPNRQLDEFPQKEN